MIKTPLLIRNIFWAIKKRVSTPRLEDKNQTQNRPPDNIKNVPPAMKLSHLSWVYLDIKKELSYLQKKEKKYLVMYNLKSLTSKATPLATQFFKRAYKISHFPGLWASWFDLPSFATLSKIWSNFKCKVFLNLKLSKNHLNKKCAQN